VDWFVKVVSMTLVRRALARVVRERVQSPKLRKWLELAENSFELVRNSAAGLIPALVTPSPRNLTVAITAKCNLRCVGCRYGRDYMTGHELPTGTVKRLLRDAAAGGISTVRLYGGEPLLHAGLTRMIAESVACRITPFVTTNGRLLDRKLDSLFDAGLRIITLGYYGHGETYDRYVGRLGAWDKFERVLADARGKYGEKLSLHMSYVLSTRTCSAAELEKAWKFATRYNLTFHIDLIHYSLPYFTEGPNRELQFFSDDLQRIQSFVSHLLELKRERPDLYRESAASIRSIPDWLLKGPAMRVPCDAYDMIWVGADGSVRLCFVTFPLGNLHHNPLRRIARLRRAPCNWRVPIAIATATRASRSTCRLWSGIRWDLRSLPRRLNHWRSLSFRSFSRSGLVA
jgi:cyclic pyranopterin phosphate synthase